MSGKITEIAGGQIITRTKGDITMRVTNGSLHLQAGEKTVLRGKDNGITFGIYTPEETPPHPQIERVAFLDENDRVLNAATDDFYYGQPLKIRITTKEAAGQSIGVALKGETKSANQPFKFMNTSRYRWSGVVAADNTFTTPLFTLLPLWYSDDFETYNDSTHKTEIAPANLNAFYAGVTLNSQTAELPAAGARPKPRAYLRNYEEGIGLFKPGSTPAKDLSDNYEKSFIRKYTRPGLHSLNIEDLVERLSNWLYRDHPEANANAIETIAAQIGSDLWHYAALQNQEHIITHHDLNLVRGREETNRTVVAAIADDRPLYWARNAMAVMLKRQYAFIADIKANHAAGLDAFLQNSVVPPGSALWNTLQTFEDKSRNYSGIDFSRAAGIKKILITGFDPFGLNEAGGNRNNNTLQANPSGILALSLHGLTIGNGYIQTLIVPVRYTDFDGSAVRNQGAGTGIIERYIGPLIREVDMVVTISQFDESGSVIDKFATSRRGGFPDNQNHTRIAESQSITGAEEWIETTLPEAFVRVPVVRMNWSFTHVSSSNGAAPPAATPPTTIINPIDNHRVPPLTPKLIEGSGESYLSNEIFYRVAKLRKNQRSSLPTGHFHVKKIQTQKSDLNPALIATLLATVKASFERGIAALP